MIIFTNKNLKFEDIVLKDELGYWDKSNIYVYTYNLSRIQIFGILVHELVEWFFWSQD